MPVIPIGPNRPEEEGRGNDAAVGGRGRRALEALHALRLVGAVEDPADAGRPRRGRVLLHDRRHALPRLQQPADGRQHRSRRQARDRRDREAGRHAALRHAVRGLRDPGAPGPQARGAMAGRPGEVLLHAGRRRGERERGAHGEGVHGPREGAGPLPLVPRRDVPHGEPDRRSAPLGEREPARARRRAGARSLPRPRPSAGHRRAGARPARGADHARGPRHDRGVHPGDRHRHERCA